MVVRSVKKVGKYRAHTTHGGGHRKKRRGAGSRGGRGNAGSGKRAGHKRQGKVLGRKGFLPRGRVTVNSRGINIGQVCRESEAWIKKGKATREGDVVAVDLGKLGFSTLLGMGKASCALKVCGVRASVKAREKLEAAGGSLTE